jgi:hypothetical protein
MSSSKKRDFAAGVYMSDAQNPIPPPLTHSIRVYSILIHIGKGERGGTSEKVKGATGYKGGSKITT